MIKSLILLSLIAISSFVQADGSQSDKNIHISNTDNLSTLPNSSERLTLGLQKLGEGEMNYLFWHVYNAEFYAKQNKFNVNNYPQALKLTYKRDIEKADFVEATIDQWDKLHKLDNNILVTSTQRKAWKEKLQTIFPDIHTNDIILLVVNEKKESHFYLKKFETKTATNNNYTLIGTINEPDFGAYFLSIWLSEYTSEPKLRKKLIGEAS